MLSVSQNPRCIHGLVPDFCAICRGLVTAENQTRIYHEDRAKRKPSGARRTHAYGAVDRRIRRDIVVAKFQEWRKGKMEEKGQEPKKSKACNKCGKEKPLDEFGVKHERPDGRNTTCKECVSAYQREWEARKGKKRAVGKKPPRPPRIQAPKVKNAMPKAASEDELSRVQRTIRVLVSAGHVTEEQVRKAYELVG